MNAENAAQSASSSQPTPAESAAESAANSAPSTAPAETSAPLASEPAQTPDLAPTSAADAASAAASGTMDEDIIFRTRKWVKPEDLNANGTLFGGSLLRWIDEESAIYAIIQMGNPRSVTKLISEINFVSSARQGDMIEMGLRAVKFGRTSLTMRAKVRNIITGEVILTIDKIVFVSLDEDGNPKPHGYTDITFKRDRIPTSMAVTPPRA